MPDKRLRPQNLGNQSDSRAELNQPQPETTLNRIREHTAIFPRSSVEHEIRTVTIVTAGQNIVHPIDLQPNLRHFFCSGFER